MVLLPHNNIRFDMYVLIVTLLATTASVSHGSNYKKCCKSMEILSEVNSTYRCVKDDFKRLDVVTNETDFLRTNLYGECVDISEEMFVFTVTNGKVVGKRHISEKYFPKCCPLKYTYNSVLHSCEEIGQSTHSYIKENFVEVGLPNCKLIVDYELNDTLESYYNLLKNPLQHDESYCIDVNEKGSFILRVCKNVLDICDHIRCIKKCCPDGQSFINGSQCFDTYKHGLNLSSLSRVEKAEEPYAIISNRTCPRIYVFKENKYNFSLDDQGIFTYWEGLEKSFVRENVTHEDSYCIEHAKTKKFEGYLFFMCFTTPPPVKKFEYTLWPKILSCICLLVTIFVYMILKERKSVFGNVLVNYCIALFFGSALLIYAQQHTRPTKIDCTLRAFFIIFLSIAAFSWSNVVCYDIWRTFGSVRGAIGEYHRKRTLKKLSFYIFYGWGIPTIITVLVFLFHRYRILPYAVQPFLAEVKCFFNKREGNYSMIIFYNLPELIMQLGNTILFFKTVIYCQKVKKEIDRINDTTKDDKNKKYQKDKERLFLILKLLVIMGISFTFEVVSSFFDMDQMGKIPRYIEVVWDTINCLQGVFIFIIFICKKKILRDLLKRFRVLVPRKTSSSSIYTQSTTLSGNSKKSRQDSDNRKSGVTGSLRCSLI